MDPFTHLVYATKQLEGVHPYRVARGIAGPGHPIFNFRGEYDKLGECGRRGDKGYRDY